MNVQRVITDSNGDVVAVVVGAACGKSLVVDRAPLVRVDALQVLVAERVAKTAWWQRPAARRKARGRAPRAWPVPPADHAPPSAPRARAGSRGTSYGGRR
jgi:hypothetical protein